MYLRKGRRGQVTIFIIVGVLILAVVVLLLSLRSTKEKISPPQVKTIVENVPLHAQPVQDFVTNCVDALTKEAVIAIGAHGGWIGTDVASQKYTKEMFKIHPASVVESDALTFSQGSSLKIPYWWYLSTPNTCSGDCVFSSKRPTLYRANNGDSSIESQIDRYVTLNLPACLQSFSSFKEQGMIIKSEGPIETTTRVREHDVVVSVSYPLEIITKTGSAHFTEYVVVYPVEIKRLYELATEIVEMERAFHFVEQQMWNVISTFTGSDTSKLPPLYEFRIFDPHRVTWTKQNVDTKIKLLLTSYIPQFQIQNTRNYIGAPSSYDVFHRDLYYQFQLPPLVTQDNLYQQFSASFNYLNWWDVYSAYQCEGCSGGIIKGLIGFPGLPLLSDLVFEKYQTRYDLSFPVVVHLVDTKSKDDFQFTFAFEANMRNGEPLNVTYTEFAAPSAPIIGSLTCAESQRNTGNITVIALDAVTKNALKGVQLTYGCGEGCYLGATHELEDQRVGLRTQFPICVGGLLSGSVNGYTVGLKKMNTYLGKEGEVSLELYKKIDKNIKLLAKRNVLSIHQKKVGDVISFERNWSFNPIASPLRIGESAAVILERVKEHSSEEDIITGAEITVQSPLQTVTLIPGKYKVSITLISKTPFTIPEKKIDGGLFADDVTIPAMSFDEKNPFIEGTLSLGETSDSVIEITADDLYAEKDLVLYAYAAVQPVTGIIQEDLGNLDAKEFMRTHTTEFYPTFEKQS